MTAKKILLILLAIIIVFSGVTIWWRYYNVYSDGNRVGILYKFSHKGNIFKTYEGELILPGVNSNKKSGGINSNAFRFCVLDKALADSLTKVQGNEVEVHYYQYRKPLPWRGDGHPDPESGKTTQYVVDKIVKVRQPESINPYGM